MAAAGQAGGFNAASYGATGDGTTDDFAALQAAINAAGAAAPAVLHINPGVYIISDLLVYPSNITIRGAGIDVTTIRNSSGRSPSATWMLYELGFGSLDIHDTTIEHITWDQRGDLFGDAHDQALMGVDGTRNVVVQYCGFRNAITMAIHCDATTARPTQGHRALSNHVFESNGGGLSYFGEMTGFEISGNTVEHTQDDALAVQDTVSGVPHGGVITGNTILDCDSRNSYDSTPRGITVWGSYDVEVTDNTITDVFASGVLVCEGTANRAHDVLVDNNDVSGAGANNTTSGVGTYVPAYGFFLANCDDVTITGNTSTGSRDADHFYVGDTGTVDSGNSWSTARAARLPVGVTGRAVGAKVAKVSARLAVGVTGRALVAKIAATAARLAAGVTGRVAAAVVTEFAVNVPFTGTSGAWPAPWVGSGNAGSSADLSSNQGRMTAPTAAYQARREWYGAVEYDDVNITFTASIANPAREDYIIFSYRGDQWQDNAAGNPLNGYSVELDVALALLVLYRTDAGTRTVLDSAAYATTPGTSVKIRVQAAATTHQARIWNLGSGEPGTWQVGPVTDSTYTEGLWGLAFATAASLGTKLFDDVVGTISLPGGNESITTTAGDPITTTAGDPITTGA
jgi:hypothetical protein